MMYERLQSLVSYASYQKATCVDTVEGGTCCLPYCNNDTIAEHDGYELQGWEAVCPECEIVLNEYAPEELTQCYASTRIHYIRKAGVIVGVAKDNDDDLPF